MSSNTSWFKSLSVGWQIAIVSALILAIIMLIYGLYQLFASSKETTKHHKKKHKTKDTKDKKQEKDDFEDAIQPEDNKDKPSVKERKEIHIFDRLDGDRDDNTTADSDQKSSKEMADIKNLLEQQKQDLEQQKELQKQQLDEIQALKDQLAKQEQKKQTTEGSTQTDPNATEQELKHLEEERKKLEEAKKKMEEEAKTNKDALNNKDEEINNLKQQLETLKNGPNANNNAGNDLTSLKNRAKQLLEDIDNLKGDPDRNCECYDHGRQLDSLRDDVNTLLNQIPDEMPNPEANPNFNPANFKHKLDGYENDYKELEKDMMGHKNRLDNLRNRIEGLKEQLRPLQGRDIDYCDKFHTYEGPKELYNQANRLAQRAKQHNANADALEPDVDELRDKVNNMLARLGDALSSDLYNRNRKGIHRRYPRRNLDHRSRGRGPGDREYDPNDDEYYDENYPSDGYDNDGDYGYSPDDGRRGENNGGKNKKRKNPNMNNSNMNKNKKRRFSDNSKKWLKDGNGNDNQKSEIDNNGDETEESENEELNKALRNANKKREQLKKQNEEDAAKLKQLEKINEESEELKKKREALKKSLLKTSYQKFPPLLHEKDYEYQFEKQEITTFPEVTFTKLFNYMKDLNCYSNRAQDLLDCKEHKRIWRFKPDDLNKEIEAHQYNKDKLYKSLLVKPRKVFTCNDIITGHNHDVRSVIQQIHPKITNTIMTELITLKDQFKDASTLDKELGSSLLTWIQNAKQKPYKYSKTLKNTLVEQPELLLEQGLFESKYTCHLLLTGWLQDAAFIFATYCKDNESAKESVQKTYKMILNAIGFLVKDGVKDASTTNMIDSVINKYKTLISDILKPHQNINLEEDNIKNSDNEEETNSLMDSKGFEYYYPHLINSMLVPQERLPKKRRNIKNKNKLKNRTFLNKNFKKKYKYY